MKNFRQVLIESFPLLRSCVSSSALLFAAALVVALIAGFTLPPIVVIVIGTTLAGVLLLMGITELFSAGSKPAEKSNFMFSSLSDWK